MIDDDEFPMHIAADQHVQIDTVDGFLVHAGRQATQGQRRIFSVMKAQAGWHFDRQAGRMPG